MEKVFFFFVLLFSYPSGLTHAAKGLETLSTELQELELVDNAWKAHPVSKEELYKAIQKTRHTKNIAEIQKYAHTAAGKHLIPALLFYLTHHVIEENMLKTQHDLNEGFLFLHEIMQRIEERYAHSDVVTIISYDVTQHLAFEALLLATLFATGYKKVIIHAVNPIYSNPHTQRREKNSLHTLLKTQSEMVANYNAPWDNDKTAQVHLGLWPSAEDFITSRKAKEPRLKKQLFDAHVFFLIDPFPWGEQKRADKAHTVLRFIEQINRDRQNKPIVENNRIDIKFDDNSTALLLIPSSDVSPLLYWPKSGHEDELNLLAQIFQKISAGASQETDPEIHELKQHLMSKTHISAPGKALSISFWDLFALTAQNNAVALSLPRAAHWREIKQIMLPVTAQKIVAKPNITTYGKQHTGIWLQWDKAQNKFVPVF